MDEYKQWNVIVTYFLLFSWTLFSEHFEIEKEKLSIDQVDS